MGVFRGISSPTGGIGLQQQVAHGMPHIGLTWLGFNIFLGCVPGAYVLLKFPHNRLCRARTGLFGGISSPTGGIGLLQQVAHGMAHIGLTWLG